MNDLCLSYETNVNNISGIGGEKFAYMSVLFAKMFSKDTEEVPIWHKYSLSIDEAASYYGIGEKRLRQIANEHKGEEFLLEIGTHVRFKRKLFEEFLNSSTTI